MLFDKSPGPGTYKVNGEGKEESILNKSSLKQSPNTRQINYKEIAEKSMTEGNCFPRESRFKDSIDYNIPGPTTYCPIDPHRKSVSLVHMAEKSRVEISENLLKNPINFVKPLVINLYYKKGIPPVGTYDPKYPSDIAEVA